MDFIFKGNSLTGLISSAKNVIYNRKKRVNNILVTEKVDVETAIKDLYLAKGTDYIVERGTTSNTTCPLQYERWANGRQIIWGECYPITTVHSSKCATGYLSYGNKKFTSVRAVFCMKDTGDTSVSNWADLMSATGDDYLNTDGCTICMDSYWGHIGDGARYHKYYFLAIGRWK